jgi:hypothetical protein
MDRNSGGRSNTLQLILIPSVITLGVTILRLLGELNNWSDFWFSKAPGGGLSPIGISWLIPIFGVYFALRLMREGKAAAKPGRVILLSLLAIAIAVVASLLSFTFISREPGHPASIVLLSVLLFVLIYMQRNGWPALFKTLLAYAFAARIPVAILMLIAIAGNWGTHYDVPPSETFPAMHWFWKWVVIGAIPQLFLWIWVTVTLGSLCGGITALLRGSKQSETVHA